MDTDTEAAIPPDWRDLNRTQRDVLVLLARIGPAANRDLRERIGTVDKATVSRALAALDAKGYVHHETGDGVADDNTLTLDGLALVKRAVVDPSDELRDAEDLVV